MNHIKRHRGGVACFTALPCCAFENRRHISRGVSSSPATGIVRPAYLSGFRKQAAATRPMSRAATSCNGLSPAVLAVVSPMTMTYQLGILEPTLNRHWEGSLQNGWPRKPLPKLLHEKGGLKHCCRNTTVHEDIFNTVLLVHLQQVAGTWCCGKDGMLVVQALCEPVKRLRLILFQQNHCI